MLDRLRRTLLSSLLLAPACGDSGSDTAGATQVTAPLTTTADDSSSGAPGETTQQPSGEPTTDDSAATTTTTTTTAATTTTPPDDTTGDATTTADDTTGRPDPSTTTTGVDDSTSTTADDTTGGGPVCGDGVVGPGETCDDGSGVGCDTYHDGGDGTCVPPDQCVDGYVLSEGACVAELVAAHVHIMVDNFCNMDVDPKEFSVLPGQKLKLEYHNHSVDYPVDVWMHYNGGYTDLQPGGTWKETYEHCFGPIPSEGYADISTACSDYHLPIHCL